MAENSSQSGFPGSLHLGDARTAKDLATFITRIRSVDSQAAVRLTATGSVLAAFVSTLYPQTLLDTTPTVLGMRAMRLQAPAHVDVIVESSALLDRLARIAEENYFLKIPPVTVSAPWSGTTPPLQGWEEKGVIDAGDLFTAASEGMKAVEGALPQNPGHAVLDTVRSRIWTSPLEYKAESKTALPQEIELPSAVAFTAAVMGFLPPAFEGTLRAFCSGQWVRITAPGGYILSKRGK